MSVRLFFILIEISGDPFKSNGAHILVRTHSPRDTGKIFQFYFLAYLTDQAEKLWGNKKSVCFVDIKLNRHPLVISIQNPRPFNPTRRPFRLF